MKFTIHINGNISTEEGEEALEQVVFSCIKDDEIKYANEWLDKRVNKNDYDL